MVQNRRGSGENSVIRSVHRVSRKKMVRSSQFCWEVKTKSRLLKTENRLFDWATQGSLAIHARAFTSCGKVEEQIVIG